MHTVMTVLKMGEISKTEQYEKNSRRRQGGLDKRDFSQELDRSFDFTSLSGARSPEGPGSSVSLHKLRAGRNNEVSWHKHHTTTRN